MAEFVPVWEIFEVDASADQPASLPISPGPATGYRWELTLPAGVEKAEEGPARETVESARLGSAASGALRVKAKRGEHVIEAKLVRPWAPDDPIRRVRITLHVS